MPRKTELGTHSFPGGTPRKELVLGYRSRGFGACAPFCPLGAQDRLPCKDPLQEWERILKAPRWEATLLCREGRTQPTKYVICPMWVYYVLCVHYLFFVCLLT